MYEKKKRIIDAAISLFAEKGFSGSSIQEITEASGVSKGAFYLHFSSKNDLLLQIFRYYYNLMTDKVEQAYDPGKSPKENFCSQIQIRIREVERHRKFILMQFQEQALTLDRELLHFLRRKDAELKKWYRDCFIAMYGPAITPYAIDLAVMLEGIQNSFLHLLLQNSEPLPADRLTDMIVQASDALADRLIKDGQLPLLSEQQLAQQFTGLYASAGTPADETVHLLNEMAELLNRMELDTETVKDLQSALDILQSEVKKPRPKKVLIQGVLANFNGFPEFDSLKKAVAETLDIRIL